jgi:predicted esterase
MVEKHLSVPRMARYFAIGEAGPATLEVWFMLHGYGQLASSFAHQCEALADPRRLVLVPEALSRFYLGDHFRPGAETKVGASWMTREDRANEIADYVRYLDHLYAHVFRTVNRDQVTVHVLGFSQGVPTATRWLTRGEARADRLIIWGAPLPNDLTPEQETTLRRMKLVLVAGNKDEFYTPKVLKGDQALLARTGANFRVIEFKGRHAIDADVLKQLADS